jgi:hypothetical protein
LTVSLPICIPFIPSSCLIALARNSSTMLNRSGDTYTDFFDNSHLTVWDTITHCDCDLRLPAKHFLCIYWRFVHLLQKDVCSDLLLSSSSFGETRV